MAAKYFNQSDEQLDSTTSLWEKDGTAKGNGHAFVNTHRAAFHRLQRRRSASDVAHLHSDDVLSPSHMEIDVELAGQYLTMKRRQAHVDATIASLKVLFFR